MTRNNWQNKNVFNIFLYYTCLIPNVTTACHYTAWGQPNCVLFWWKCKNEECVCVCSTASEEQRTRGAAWRCHSGLWEDPHGEVQPSARPGQDGESSSKN